MVHTPPNAPEVKTTGGRTLWQSHWGTTPLQTRVESRRLWGHALARRMGATLWHTWVGARRLGGHTLANAGGVNTAWGPHSEKTVGGAHSGTRGRNQDGRGHTLWHTKVKSKRLGGHTLANAGGINAAWGPHSGKAAWGPLSGTRGRSQDGRGCTLWHTQGKSRRLGGHTLANAGDVNAAWGPHSGKVVGGPHSGTRGRSQDSWGCTLWHTQGKSKRLGGHTLATRLGGHTLATRLGGAHSGNMLKSPNPFWSHGFLANLKNKLEFCVAGLF